MLKDTIISAFNYDGTLLKWLKKVEDALQNASASEFRVNKKGNATISFSIVFANGDTLESGDIVLQQGESVTGATIRQGHLILTLSNGNELDAGDVGAVTGFSINESQHLIITYQNGTTQDLGAIFTGNVNIDGNFTANSIIENMAGYSFSKNTDDTHFTKDYVFVGAVKNGNKLTFSVFMKFTPHNNNGGIVGQFYIPSEIHNKLIPTPIGTTTDKLLASQVYCYSNFSVGVSCPYWVDKIINNGIRLAFSASGLTLETEYIARFEFTFLLSNNMVS